MDSTLERNNTLKEAMRRVDEGVASMERPDTPSKNIEQVLTDGVRSREVALQQLDNDIASCRMRIADEERKLADLLESRRTSDVERRAMRNALKVFNEAEAE